MSNDTEQPKRGRGRPPLSPLERRWAEADRRKRREKEYAANKKKRLEARKAARKDKVAKQKAKSALLWTVDEVTGRRRKVRSPLSPDRIAAQQELEERKALRKQRAAEKKAKRIPPRWQVPVPDEVVADIWQRVADIGGHTGPDVQITCHPLLVSLWRLWLDHERIAFAIDCATGHLRTHDSAEVWAREVRRRESRKMT